MVHTVYAFQHKIYYTLKIWKKQALFYKSIFQFHHIMCYNTFMFVLKLNSKFLDMKSIALEQ
jgi:hypothetical protein